MPTNLWWCAEHQREQERQRKLRQVASRDIPSCHEDCHHHWEKDEPAHDRRQADPEQPVPGEAGETAPVKQQMPEESGDKEEQLHPERVRREKEPVEAYTSGRIYDWSTCGCRNEAPGGMEDDAKQQGEGAGGIEGVEPFRVGCVAHTSMKGSQFSDGVEWCLIGHFITIQSRSPLSWCSSFEVSAERRFAVVVS